MLASLAINGVERFRQVFEKSPNAYLLLAPDFTIIACNEAYEQAVGRLRDAMVGRLLFEVFPAANPEQRERVQASLAWVFRERRRHTLPMLQYPVAHLATLASDSPERWWTVTHVPLFNVAGDVECVLSHPTDITELTRLRANQGGQAVALVEAHGLTEEPVSDVQWVRGMQHMLAAERDYLQQLFKQAPGFICVLRGPNHVFELANDAYLQLVGHRTVLGQRLVDALPEVAEQGYLDRLDTVLATGTPFIGRALPIALQREAHGPLEERYIDLVYQPIRELDGTVSGIFVQGHDVTDAHELAREVAWQAAHDPLTGLYNRREFASQLDALAQVCDEPSAAEGPHALLYLDIDQFKLVNDHCGHASGDELLRQVADTLKQQVRASDILARLGGDEFALVLRNCPLEVAVRIANALRERIATLDFVWAGRRFGTTLSVGLVAFGSALSVPFEQALSQADAACFLAKEKGRNRVQVYRHGDAEMHRQRHDMDWASRLRDCMAEDRVVLYGQRIVDLRDPGGVTHAWEMLARLREPDGTLVPPSAFIPAAERYGIMPALDRHIIRLVFVRMHHMPEPKRSATSYFVNLSGATLNDDTLPEYVQALQAEFFDVHPEQVCFEVTETAAVSNLNLAAAAMQQLVDQGYRFALDDFGSGMSSFSYLRRLPVQYVKIDGEFVQGILHDPVNAAMVDAVTRVAHTMGILTIAEFVESPDILQRLVSLGVDFGQGFGLHEPEPM